MDNQAEQPTGEPPNGPRDLFRALRKSNRRRARIAALLEDRRARRTRIERVMQAERERRVRRGG